MRLFFRTFLLSFFRHILLLGALSAWQNFDVSPLPLWTWSIVAYLLHFIITFFFAEWALLRHFPTWRAAVEVLLVFLITGTLIENAVYVLLTKAGWWDFLSTMRWEHLYVVGVQFLAVFAAAFWLRRRKVKATLPEGLEG